jgi:hypothetical protein
MRCRRAPRMSHTTLIRGAPDLDGSGIRRLTLGWPLAWCMALLHAPGTAQGEISPWLLVGSRRQGHYQEERQPFIDDPGRRWLRSSMSLGAQLLLAQEQSEGDFRVTVRPDLAKTSAWKRRVIVAFARQRPAKWGLLLVTVLFRLGQYGLGS